MSNIPESKIDTTTMVFATLKHPLVVILLLPYLFFIAITYFIVAFVGKFGFLWLLFLLAVILLPAYLVYLSVLSSRKTERQVLECLFTALQKVDYYHNGIFHGIALDAGSKKFSAVEIRGRKAKLHSFLLDEIESVTVSSPGLRPIKVNISEQVSVLGTRNISVEESATDRSFADMQRMLKTGVVFNFKDITAKPLLVTTGNRAAAEKWQRILSQLSQGTLPHQPAPFYAD